MRSRLVVNRLRSACIITMKSGEAFRGALWDADNRVIILRSAEQIQTKGDVPTLPVDGELLVWVSDVAYVQLLDAPRRAGDVP